MTTRIRTTCNRDCPDSCGIVATVEDGRIEKHEGDPEHGVTRGFLCYRGNHYLERFYSPERILHPLRRTDRGWQRLSWDDALDLAAEKLLACREAHGPLSVLLLSYSGIKGMVARLLARRFWARFGGCTSTRGGISVEAAVEAQVKDLGATGTHAPEDLENSAAIVVWGKNVAVTRPHCIPFIDRARKRSAKLWVIDPVRCKTARRADRHLALRPGSDALLAAGVARLLIERGAVDQGFVERHCAGFDAYRERVLSIELEDVAAATDLSLEDIGGLADLYATVRPLATLAGLGPSYWRRGGEAVRLIDALGALSGNIGVPGGGVHTDIMETPGLDLSPFRELSRGERRELLLPRLGEEIPGACDPPLRVGFVAGANPAATCPDSGRVREALSSLEFLVVVDQFETATAELADLFLPCTTYLEMEDLVCAYGHHWLGLSQAVVPPQGEARPDAEILKALADRLGFGEALAGEPRSWIERLLAPLAEHGVTYEELKRRPMRNPLAVPIPFADRRFATPSGRFELIADFDPRAPAVEGESLRLVATKTLKMVNAQINPGDLADEPSVRVHPETAAARGLADGDAVLVESRAGRVSALLKTDPHVRRDVLLFNPAAWRGDPQGVNQLRESAVADLGEAAAMHETAVSLRRLPDAGR